MKHTKLKDDDKEIVNEDKDDNDEEVKSIYHIYNHMSKLLSGSEFEVFLKIQKNGMKRKVQSALKPTVSRLFLK